MRLEWKIQDVNKAKGQDRNSFPTDSECKIKQTSPKQHQGTTTQRIDGRQALRKKMRPSDCREAFSRPLDG